MNSIVKICKKHGELPLEKIKINTRGILICTICQQQSQNKYREKNKEKFQLKRLQLQKLNEEHKLIKKCHKHGLLQSKDIIINCRSHKCCNLCIQESSLNSYYKKKSLLPESLYFKRIKAKKAGACLIHGDNTRNSSGQCRECGKLRMREYRKDPEKKELLKEKQNRYRRNNLDHKEKTKRRVKGYYENKPDEYRKQLRERAKEYRDKLPDAYLKQVIRKDRMFRKENINIPTELIPQELIDIKRLHLKLKREIKRKENNGN